MTRRFVPILCAAALPALAFAAESPKEWRVTVWPNAALLAEQQTQDGYLNLVQSISCVPGEKAVTWRTYTRPGQPRRQGTRKGCDTQCRTEVVATGSDGPNPAGFTERRQAWSSTIGDAISGAPPEAVAAFARACRLRPPSASPLQLDASAARTWSDPKVNWRLIEQRANRSTLPFDFPIPADAFAYGATSTPLSTEAPAIVRLEVEGLNGRSGVALVSPDGSTLRSGERVVSAGERALVLLRLKPGEPAAVLLRNYDNAGTAGMLRVLRVEVISEAASTPDERAAAR